MAPGANPHILSMSPPLLRPVHRDDGPLLPEEEDRLLCDPDIHAVLHDRHPLPGVLLAQQRVRPRQDRLR